ncbi:hypothetical protein BO86DRAFT_406462 [Aspergillus japonicus CBS 114.51]|uniref:Uncharacterized protein n=1 Tax=Aspergillus japonicus CBS 114.51 TaxID=1448312 RepID=A0A8T8XDD6_ASPJA|nr:hypothetical protein BO86DRAFT_406462 [Aspergillus japonicus CBS 114.51]RAH86041.1 hypothetical protein BO86DRAFT_406462 [Aspergillus japonicus CBS 114.51]
MPFWSWKGSKTKPTHTSKSVDRTVPVSKETECREKYKYAKNRYRRLSADENYRYQDAVKEWAGKYTEEAALGILILQRLHRLQLLGPRSSKKLHRHPRGEDGQILTTVRDSMPPPIYVEPIPEDSCLEAEMTQLRKDYWKHQLRLQELYRGRPHPTGPTMALFLAGHEYRNEHGQPYDFVDSQRECAKAGGCCARSCGCCQKGLYANEDKKDQTSPVYGHCTLECVCCIRFRQCYVPDGRLSPPKTKPLLR